jgi:uncharacterized membrane protein
VREKVAAKRDRQLVGRQSKVVQGMRGGCFEDEQEVRMMMKMIIMMMIIIVVVVLMMMHESEESRQIAKTDFARGVRETSVFVNKPETVAERRRC